MYSDKTATTLKTNAIVSNPVHVVLFNFMKELCRCITDHGHTIPELLSVTRSGSERPNGRGRIRRERKVSQSGCRCGAAIRRAPSNHSQE